jgi:hypothetical protein
MSFNNCSLSGPQKYVCLPSPGETWMDGHIYMVSWNYQNSFYNTTPNTPREVDIMVFYNNTKYSPIMTYSGIPTDIFYYTVTINDTWFQIGQNASAYSKDSLCLLYVISTNSMIGSTSINGFPAPVPIHVIRDPAKQEQQPSQQSTQPTQQQQTDSHDSFNFMPVIVGVVLGVGVLLMLCFIWCFCYKSDRTPKKPVREVIV